MKKAAAEQAKAEKAAAAKAAKEAAWAKACQARPSRAGESSACAVRGSRRTPVLTPPAAPGASFSDMRTLPTMSTLFCNQRKPVIDP